jgi:ubiquinone/menaquinone biosynthesis C-methylase UbiE
MTGTSPADFYSARYSARQQKLRDAIFSEVYDNYFGQSSWVSTADYDRFAAWLELTPRSIVLDIACGSGQPALRLAGGAGCRVVAIDQSKEAISLAVRHAAEKNLSHLAGFHCCDAARPLPFGDATFDAVVCIDALAHLSEHGGVFAEWSRVLRSSGGVVFTAQALTGAITNIEVAARFPFGYYTFGPEGHDERELTGAGFEVIRRENLTSSFVQIASAHCYARARHAEALRAAEGDEEFELQNRYRAVAEKLAREGRLSHFAYLARKCAPILL